MLLAIIAYIIIALILYLTIFEDVNKAKKFPFWEFLYKLPIMLLEIISELLYIQVLIERLIVKLRGQPKPSNEGL